MTLLSPSLHAAHLGAPLALDASSPAERRSIVAAPALDANRFDRPILDADRLLWFGDRWVAVTDLQAPVMELLLAELGRWVAREEICATYAAAGGSAKDDAVYSVMRRLGRRARSVGADVEFTDHGTAMKVSVPAATVASPR